MKLDFNSLKFKNWLYIMLFSVFILVVLWVLQIVFLQSFYQSMKTNEIVKTGNKIVNEYGKETFNDALDEYAFKDNLRIYLFDEHGNTIVESDGFRTSIGKSLMPLPQGEVHDVKRRFTNNKPIAINYTNGDKNRIQLVYAALLIGSNGQTNYLYIRSSLPPIDSTIAVLKTQLIIITLILLILSLLVAQIISRKLSIPLIKLTKSARQLAEGNMNIEFYNGGYTEIHQLSSTLSYATKELSKLDEYRKEFIANVSHDLKTPLTIIKCYGEMIRDVSGDNPEKRKSHCEIIIKETDRLTDLVSEVLELSKLQSNNAEIINSEFDLSRCLVEILNSFNVLSKKEGYVFIVDVQKNLSIVGDEQYIRRVIYNLISNAVNYTGDDKHVTVKLTDSGGKVRFEVTDTGNGIPEEQIASIWDRYYKASQTHKRAVVGTGIGLSIVKNALTMHNAEYGVISEKGVGSTFWFELKR